MNTFFRHAKVKAALGDSQWYLSNKNKLRYYAYERTIFVNVYIQLYLDM